MDGIFTLPYSEFNVVNRFQHLFSKADGYSVYIPVSRQEKAVDFLLLNGPIRTVARFQVKSSRTYVHETKSLKSGVLRPPKYRYNLWLNNFKNKYIPNLVDFYVIFGLYPVYESQMPIKADFWKSIILCFRDQDMKSILDQVKTKKEQKDDKFFGFSFNKPGEVFGTRGFLNDCSVSDFLLEKKVDEIKNWIKSQKPNQPS